VKKHFLYYFFLVYSWVGLALSILSFIYVFFCLNLLEWSKIIPCLCKKVPDELETAREDPLPPA
jgi:hypothetical protein